MSISPGILIAPFIIHTGKAVIEVLGTSFNVVENSLNNETEVIVKEGIVALSGTNGTSIPQDIIGMALAANSSAAATIQVLLFRG